jgi:hypothetical protein
MKSKDAVASRQPSNAPVGEIRRGVFGWSEVVVRGGVEPPTFRFSGMSTPAGHRY